jgi:hypothetical protein
MQPSPKRGEVSSFEISLGANALFYVEVHSGMGVSMSMPQVRIGRPPLLVAAAVPLFALTVFTLPLDAPG